LTLASLSAIPGWVRTKEELSICTASFSFFPGVVLRFFLRCNLRWSRPLPPSEVLFLTSSLQLFFRRQPCSLLIRQAMTTCAHRFTSRLVCCQFPPNGWEEVGRRRTLFVPDREPVAEHVCRTSAREITNWGLISPHFKRTQSLLFILLLSGVGGAGSRKDKVALLPLSWRLARPRAVLSPAPPLSRTPPNRPRSPALRTEPLSDIRLRQVPPLRPSPFPSTAVVP